MRSIISSRGQVIDNRRLIMHLSYFSLPLDKVHALANEFYLFVTHLLPNFILDWKFQNRSFKDLTDVLRKKCRNNGSFNLLMRGNLICKEVYNKTTFRRYEHDILYPAFPQHLRGTTESVDYPLLRRKRSTLTWDPILEKEAALELFNLEGKYYLADAIIPDALAFGNNAPMDLGEPLYYGDYLLMIPLYCLEDMVSHTADKLLRFCLELEGTFKNINASVELNPEENCYTRYFGYSVESGLAAELPYRNIARCLYFSEFGWGNVISQITATLGIPRTGHEKNEYISTSETPSGGLCIRCDKPILETTIADLKIIKEAMYRVILPRYHILPGIRNLRSYWEVVPVFDDELTVYRIGYIFQHRGDIDFDRFCKMLKMK